MTQLRSLYMTSCMSSIADPFCRALADCLHAALARPVQFVDGIPYAQRERLLESGDIQLGWICGLLYVEKVRNGSLPCAPVAAPVMQGPRYENAPIYFADLIVHRSSAYCKWADLRGATWAYNEEASYSGYHMLLAHMARRGESRSNFGDAVRSGGHLESIRLVRQRAADVAAIDSTVLDAAVRADPQLARDVRVVHSVGPRPMPPWVLSTEMAPTTRRAVQQALTTLHRSAAGAAALALGGMARLDAVDDPVYDTVRRDMAYRGPSSSV